MGVKNPVGANFKNDLLDAWKESGGYDNLVKYMKDPKNFRHVVDVMSRLLPRPVEGTGEDGKIMVEIMHFGEEGKAIDVTPEKVERGKAVKFKRPRPLEPIDRNQLIGGEPKDRRAAAEAKRVSEVLEPAVRVRQSQIDPEVMEALRPMIEAGFCVDPDEESR